MQGSKRGYYRLGPIGVTSGDIFGFYPRFASVPLTDYLIVYPKIFPIDRLAVPSLHPLGESKTSRRIFQDPTRTIGLREYRPQDSPKHIHWKASARHQQLQVKVFEPTTTLKISLFLAGDWFSQNGAAGAEDFELAVSVAASIAYHLVEQGGPVGLVSNACQADSGEAVFISSGGGSDQLMALLEALAKVTMRVKESSESFLERESKILPSGTTLVMVASRVQESMLWLLNDLKEKGVPVLLFLVGDQEENTPPGTIPHHYIRHPGNLLGLGSEVWS